MFLNISVPYIYPIKNTQKNELYYNNSIFEARQIRRYVNVELSKEKKILKMANYVNNNNKNNAKIGKVQANNAE